MKSQNLGKNISAAEILSISASGLWVYVEGKEYFLSCEDYPWFKNAKVAEICHLQFLHGHHLYWPDLDIDLELESLESPDSYPLVFRAPEKK